VFGEETRSNHKQFLLRRIAWRIQANAWGTCPSARAGERWRLPNDADLRLRGPKGPVEWLDRRGPASKGLPWGAVR